MFVVFQVNVENIQKMKKRNFFEKEGKFSSGLQLLADWRPSSRVDSFSETILCLVAVCDANNTHL